MKSDDEPAPPKPDIVQKEPAGPAASNLSDMIRAVTGLLWFVGAAILAIVFLVWLGPVVPKLLSHIASLSLGPEWARLEINLEDLTKGGQGPNAPQPLSKELLGPLEARARQVVPNIQGKRILWVDSNFPSANQNEITALHDLGFEIDPKMTTADAMAALNARGYALVITNMRRGDEEFAGVTLLNKMCASRIFVPAIIYSWGFDTATGVPLNAVGAAASRARLFQLIFDTAELSFPLARCLPNNCGANSKTRECQLSTRFLPASAPAAASPAEPPAP